jgi:hypothetical protein
MPALRADLDAGPGLNAHFLDAAAAAGHAAEALLRAGDVAYSTGHFALQSAVTEFGVVASGRVRAAAVAARELGSDVTGGLTTLRITEQAVAATATAK